jgi:capsular exopolysaccharide synthesis family protein
MEIAHETDAYERRFSDLVQAVRGAVARRWLTLLIVSLAVFALGAAAVLWMTPKYAPMARVQIDPSRNPLDNKSDPGSLDASLTPEAISTEVSLLGSMDVAREVVRRLGLGADPFFSKNLKSSDDQPLTPARRDDLIAAALVKAVDVSREKLTYILDVKYANPNPVTAARVTNAFAEVYVELKAGSKADTAQRQSDWFQQRLAALGQEANVADQRAAEYRAKSGIVQDSSGNNTGTIFDQQVAALSAQLASAEADSASAHAKLTAAQRQVGSGNLSAVSEVLNSPVISDLRRQRSEVQRAVEEVQVRYGEKHPESIRVHDQLNAIDSQIQEEANRVVASLAASASAADASVASLRDSVHSLQQEQASGTRAAALADSLQREAQVKRDNYTRMSQLGMTSMEAAKNKIAQAEIIEQARILNSPTSPNKPLLIALALVFGIVVGSGVIATQELLSSGLSTVEDITGKFGIPVLAMIPKLSMASPADMLLQKPTSLYSEALRIARAAILGVRSSDKRQIIAITSALPGEGKTTTAVGFARTLAINNAKTLLIECDVRRAQVRQIIGKPIPTVGLVEVLHGDATLEEAISSGDVPNLDHLIVTAPYFSSEDLFGGGNMERLLTHLRGEYEQIVLDLPPLVGLADGRFLAVLADAVALVIKWNDTPADAVRASLGWLSADGANCVGALYSMVERSASGVSGYYYSKKYSAYYASA